MHMQLFPRHLLQTPVSLKIILLLPAHHKRFQVCPVLLYSESVDEEQVKRSSTGGSLESENFLSAHLKERLKPLGLACPLPLVLLITEHCLHHGV